MEDKTLLQSTSVIKRSLGLVELPLYNRNIVIRGHQKTEIRHTGRQNVLFYKQLPIDGIARVL